MLKALMEIGRETADRSFNPSFLLPRSREPSALRAYPGLNSLLQQAERRGVLGAERSRMISRLRVN